jgi:O-antigen ligase
MPRPGKTIASYMAVLLVLAMLERTFDLETRFLNAIGRDASFTGRTEIWKMIGEQHINPVLGCGYLSFWDGLAAREYREEGGTEIVSTHNGYLEVYVDGGAVGCLLLAILLITAFRNIIRELTGGSAWNVACLMFLIAFLIYNYLESAFFRLGPIWFTFILIILKTPPLSWVSDESGEDIADGNALKTGVISAGNSEL